MFFDKVGDKSGHLCFFDKIFEESVSDIIALIHTDRLLHGRELAIQNTPPRQLLDIFYQSGTEAS